VNPSSPQALEPDEHLLLLSEKGKKDSGELDGTDTSLLQCIKTAAAVSGKWQKVSNHRKSNK